MEFDLPEQILNRMSAAKAGTRGIAAIVAKRWGRMGSVRALPYLLGLPRAFLFRRHVAWPRWQKIKPPMGTLYL